MADRVLVHLGTPKSGTTYLQQLMWSRRGALARAGVSVPGWAPDAAFLACQDLLRVEFNEWPDPAVAGSWARLVTLVRRAPGTAVVSHELFGDADADVAARALADLTGGGAAEVHLAVTVRDLARQLPAVWQEDVKNRHTLPYRDFLAAVSAAVPTAATPTAAEPGPPVSSWQGAAFWHRQDVPAVLRRWAADLPPERVHVVVVPPRGSAPDLLWQRFARVLGVDPDVAPPPAEAVNRSLGVVESELLRRLNDRLGGRVPWPVYAERVTHHLAPHVLAARSGRPLALPAGDHPWVSERASALAGQLAGAGYRVVGDLRELTVPPLPPAARPGDGPASEGELLDAALDALAGLVGTGSADGAPQLRRRVARRLARLVER